MTSTFASQPSDHGAWRDFIYESIGDISSDDECGLNCIRRPDCGYYVLDAGASTCHLGNVDRTSSILAAGTDSATVRAYSDYSRHSATLYTSVFTLSSGGAFDSGFTRWTSMVYQLYPLVIPGEPECSSICLVASGPCHFFHYANGADCFLGRFDNFDGGVLAHQAGTFYYLADKLGITI